jgi:hypothetical protein
MYPARLCSPAYECIVQALRMHVHIMVSICWSFRNVHLVPTPVGNRWWIQQADHLLSVQTCLHPSGMKGEKHKVSMPWICRYHYLTGTHLVISTWPALIGPSEIPISKLGLSGMSCGFHNSFGLRKHLSPSWIYQGWLTQCVYLLDTPRYLNLLGMDDNFHKVSVSLVSGMPMSILGLPGLVGKLHKVCSRWIFRNVCL